MTLTSLAPTLYRKEQQQGEDITGTPTFAEHRDVQNFQPATTIPQAEIPSEPDTAEQHDLVRDPLPEKREGNSRRTTTPGHRTKKDEDLAHIKASIEHILSIMPDEIHIRELLKPIEGTGKEKLREVGLRTRAYNRYFQAWENLHIVSDDDSMYARDDMVQYLRNNPDALSSSTFAET
ncbi:hypothetical protein ACJ72_07963, partial [Emergomyces africanus]